ncbi:MAG TPA: SPOR domain-containing protein [Thermoanaerobaculia bacterium]
MEEHTADDQSHYEISLTAGQAFVAFVLLLLSLAASFAFGLMLGKGQTDDRLVVQKETPVVTEASVTPKKGSGDIVELGVQNDDFADSGEETDEEPLATDSAAEVTPAAEDTVTAAPEIVEAAPVVPAPTATKPAAEAAAAPQVAAVTPPAAPAPAAKKVPHLAQLLSTSDQKTAEAMAVKLIDRGFNSAYVERGSTDKGPVFRVRVRFDSEQEARTAEPKLREFSKDVWITAR